MTRLVSAEFRALRSAVTHHVHARYGVSVELARIEPPLKGDLDGTRIFVGDHNSEEERLFLVAHLFGHTVQWNLSAELRRLGLTMPVRATARDLDALSFRRRGALAPRSFFIGATLPLPARGGGRLLACAGARKATKPTPLAPARLEASALSSRMLAQRHSSRSRPARACARASAR